MTNLFRVLLNMNNVWFEDVCFGSNPNPFLPSPLSMQPIKWEEQSSVTFEFINKERIEQKRLG